MGSWEHWEPAGDETPQIGIILKKKNSSGCQIFSLSHPPTPSTVPHFLSVTLVLLSSSLPLPLRLLSPPCVLSPPLTPGCLDGMKAPVLFSSPRPPPPEFLHSLWLRKGPVTGGPGEPPAVVMSLQTLSCGDQATGLKGCHWCWC